MKKKTHRDTDLYTQSIRGQGCEHRLLTKGNTLTRGGADLTFILYVFHTFSYSKTKINKNISNNNINSMVTRSNDMTSIYEYGGMFETLMVASVIM